MNIIRIIAMAAIITDYYNGHYAENEVEDELMWGMNFKNMLSVLKKRVDPEVFNYYDYANISLAKQNVKPKYIPLWSVNYIHKKHVFWFCF